MGIPMGIPIPTAALTGIQLSSMTIHSPHSSADTSWMRVAAIISSVTRKITAKNFISINTQNVVITD